MNKYKRLAVNTAIFTAGSFGSKIISLLLNNLYTKHISPAQLFTKSLLETLALFLIPVFTFAVTEAVIRYGLDDKYSKSQVFTTASAINLSGLLLMAVFVPLIQFIPFFSRIGSYTLLLMLYITASSLRALCSQFVRARKMVVLFSVDGILATLTLLIFNLIFISRLGMGVRGFMISMILSDLCSAGFLFITAGLRRFLTREGLSRPLAGSMLKFTLPLIPTTVMWTFTGFSDQIFIGNMHSGHLFLGDKAAGIYAAASKIPNLISMLSTIFFQAWNMSAILENDSSDRDRFYANVYSAYESLLFAGSACLLLAVKPVSALLINYSVYPEYRTAWTYTPLLIAAAVYTCFDLFLAGIYTATKNTRNAFLTILAACSANIALNLLLIPVLGMQGAALATFLSYLICFWVRIIDARRFVPFRFSIVKNVLNTALLLLVCADVIFRPEHWYLWEVLLTAVIAGINIRPLLETAKRLLKR